MSDINLDFTVSNNSIGFTVQPNDLTITPTDIQLTFNPVIQAGAGGSNTQLQYNNNGVLGGIPNVTYNGSNLSLGNVANVKITGGTNGYVLQTDGTGNLNWAAGGGGGNGAPGGSNTQIQFNDSGLFGGNNYFTFNKATGDMVIPNSLSLGSGFPLFGGNISGMYANFTAGIVANTISANVSANGLTMVGSSVALFPSINSLKIGGGLVNYIMTTDGAGNLMWASTVVNAINATNATNAVVAGTVTTNAQPNITSTGTLLNLTVSGNVTTNGANIQYGIEGVDLVGSVSGTYNFNLLDGAIRYSTSNAPGNLVLNLRGNATTTMNTFLGVGESTTATYVMTTGPTGYVVSSIQIDGSAQTVKYAGVSVAVANCVTAYTYTVIKTAATPTYTVLGSITRYI